MELTLVEARALGCLIEKEATTPDYYPLTLNALTHACNQKSNRHPVMELDEKAALRALDGLRDKKLAWFVSAAGARVPKYEHGVTDRLHLDRGQRAVLAELLLRGPQTVGELRGRASRMHEFPTANEVQAVLDRLMEIDPPLVTKLAVQPGRKEPRFAHLLCGVPEDDALPAPAEPLRVEFAAEDRRVEELEQAVRRLEAELAGLREEFERFRDQFA